MTNEQCLTRVLQRSLSRLVLTVGTILLLEACATPDSAKTVVDTQHIHRIVGSPASVIVTNVHDDSHALPFAEQYCESLGKTAKFNGMIRYKYRYRNTPTESAEFDCRLADPPRPV